MDIDMNNRISINLDKDSNKIRDISLEIQTILDNNKINDLNRFLNKRQCLNTTNTYLIYLFHLVQSAGILTTSIAAGTNNTQLVWVGIGLNIFATLINVYEKTNNSISAKLFHNIKLIKDNHYVDEGELIETSSQNGRTSQPKKSSIVSIA
jgi:hypothetical protein